MQDDYVVSIMPGNFSFLSSKWSQEPISIPKLPSHLQLGFELLIFHERWMNCWFFMRDEWTNYFIYGWWSATKFTSQSYAFLINKTVTYMLMKFTMMHIKQNVRDNCFLFRLIMILQKFVLYCGTFLVSLKLKSGVLCTGSCCFESRLWQY